MRVVAWNCAQVDATADAGIVQEFRDRVRQATRTDVVDRYDRIVCTAGPARVDDFLAAPLHFGVVALHRGEVELLGTHAGCHRRGRAAAETDQHRRAAEHDDRIAIAQNAFLHVGRAHRRETASDHDRLVVPVAHARRRTILLEGAEVAGETRPAEFVVERSAAERSVAHDLEGAGETRRQRPCAFPRPWQTGNAQIRHGKANQASLRFATAAGCPFVADFAARAGGRSRIRRNSGRMVVRLDLDRIRHSFVVRAKGAIGWIGEEACGLIARDDRGVVVIRRQRMRWRRLVGVLDHREERARLQGAIDRERRVEHLVAAVLRVRLREHHEFRIARIA